MDKTGGSSKDANSQLPHHHYHHLSATSVGQPHMNCKKLCLVCMMDPDCLADKLFHADKLSPSNYSRQVQFEPHRTICPNFEGGNLSAWETSTSSKEWGQISTKDISKSQTGQIKRKGGRTKKLE